MTSPVPSVTSSPTSRQLVSLAERSLKLSVLIPVYTEFHVAEASIRRVLALDDPIIRALQVIVVDDCSTDGTTEVLERLAEEDERVVLIQHEKNQGKGAALRTAISYADGDVSICHDADLEYNPADIPALLVPFIEEGADAVFGSRYMTASYRRALMHRHTLGQLASIPQLKQHHGLLLHYLKQCRHLHHNWSK